MLSPKSLANLKEFENKGWTKIHHDGDFQLVVLRKDTKYQVHFKSGSETRGRFTVVSAEHQSPQYTLDVFTCPEPPCPGGID